MTLTLSKCWKEFDEDVGSQSIKREQCNEFEHVRRVEGLIPPAPVYVDCGLNME